MPGGERILVAAALAGITGPLLAQEFSDATVELAEDRAAVERAIRDRVRFDVVISDLTWNGYAVEFSFDGLDVLDILRDARRPAPVVFAAQGHGIERDHLDEAVEQEEVAGVVRKAAGFSLLFEAVRTAAAGRKLPTSQFAPGDSPARVPRIHDYFSKGRGTTAARMACAIASGRAVDHETMAEAAVVSHGTATRLVDYLGPLIKGRGEHNSELRMTPEAVYRWCGEHARYILSWSRRNGLGEFATHWTAGVRQEGETGSC
jgi:DNA-binding transcriptional regulator YdaS (Cro superfamily)